MDSKNNKNNDFLVKQLRLMLKDCATITGCHSSINTCHIYAYKLSAKLETLISLLEESEINT